MKLIIRFLVFILNVGKIGIEIIVLISATFVQNWLFEQFVQVLTSILKMVTEYHHLPAFFFKARETKREIEWEVYYFWMSLLRRSIFVIL